MPDGLDFEQPLLELEIRIAALQATDDPAQADEIARLQERLERQRQRTYAGLTPWQRTQLARHPKRPHTRDWCKLRLVELAAKFGKPIITFIDTPGAYPGLGAEERGQAEAIARNLRRMASLPTPIIAVVTGEGGSGGALAIGMGNRVLMLEYAVYSVISPEGCAAILWGDAAKAPEAAEAMRTTAPELLRLGVIDGIVPEPVGGAHRDWDAAAANLRAVLREQLASLSGKSREALITERYDKFRRLGAFEEASVPGGAR